MALGQTKTLSDREIVPAEDYEEFQRQWSASGLEWCLLSIYSLGPGSSSNAGLHRLRGRPPFTAREKTIVQTVYTQIRSLHRYGENESAHEPSVRLTPRERVVLHLVLSGHSHKAIADRLGISPHTVNDYVKSLHKIFEVGSRAELQAKFFLGTQDDAENPPSTE
jgi:DNA-binding CsgD family transcriptional regulator